MNRLKSTKRLVLTFAALLAAGCSDSATSSTPPVLTEAAHSHYHVHAVDVEHEHSHDNFKNAGHSHSHDHP